MLTLVRTQAACLLIMCFVGACARGPADCMDAGRCMTVECEGAADCGRDPSRPICDTQTRSCRACMRHAECGGSFACRYDASLPETVPLGACYPASDVAVVNAERCLAGAPDGSLDHPYCQVQDALALGRPIVVVRPRGQSLPYQSVTVSSGRITILGPWREAEPQAVIEGVQVSGTNTAVQLMDLTLRGKAGDFALTCREAQVMLRRATVEYSPMGVHGAAGCRLSIERSKLAHIGRVALRTAPSARHRVMNTLFVSSGGEFTEEERANQADSVIDLGGNAADTDNVFTFNTLASNQGAISCRPGLVLRNSLVASRDRPFRNDNCAQDHLFVGDEAAAKMDARYALTEASDCCIDLARPEPEVPDDYDGAGRPQGKGYDLGCFEMR